MARTVLDFFSIADSAANKRVMAEAQRAAQGKIDAMTIGDARAFRPLHVSAPEAE